MANLENDLRNVEWPDGFHETVIEFSEHYEEIKMVFNSAHYYLQRLPISDFVQIDDYFVYEQQSKGHKPILSLRLIFKLSGTSIEIVKAQLFAGEQCFNPDH